VQQHHVAVGEVTSRWLCEDVGAACEAAHANTHTHTRTHTHARARTHARTHAHTHTHACVVRTWMTL
jgi:hypothetical protein